MNEAPNVVHYQRDPNDPSRYVREAALSAQIDFTKVFANELKGLSYNERNQYLARVQNQLMQKELAKKLGLTGD